MRRSRLKVTYFTRLEAIFMLLINSGGHSTYQDFFVTQMRKYYPDPDTIPKDNLKTLEHFWLLDLSDTDSIMESRYSDVGPKARLPSSMLRSYQLSLSLKITSITYWVAAMRVCPLYAIASGFPYGDTPGIGTFYDFFKRLWNHKDNNLTPQIKKSKKTKVKKPKVSGEKADSIEKLTVEELLPILDQQELLLEDQPYAFLFKLYKEQFLDTSISKSLIDPENLALAGDGTPVTTSARMRKKRLCDCFEKGITTCDCERYYSQPDSDIGWDSSRKCFYHGYDAYLLTDSKTDLPIFPLLAPASRHDSHGFLYNFFTMKNCLPDFNVDKLLLDAAHDAMPIFEYCKREGITPFIDLNEKRGIQLLYKNDFTIGKDGVPICKAGLKMRHDGVEKKKYRIKFRCPLFNRTHGCSCETPCSTAKYGRTVHLAMKDNPRIINIPPRDDKEWKLQYNARTSSERCNKRLKVDFLLENGRHRSTKMWYCRLYCIMMLQHLNAWSLPSESAWQKKVLQIV